MVDEERAAKRERAVKNENVSLNETYTDFRPERDRGVVLDSLHSRGEIYGQRELQVMDGRSTKQG